ncbi:hypothetical protein ABBQ38_010431 [Trebouxia sp. C0009 RCD-2024]
MRAAHTADQLRASQLLIAHNAAQEKAEYDQMRSSACEPASQIQLTQALPVTQATTVAKHWTLDEQMTAIHEYADTKTLLDNKGIVRNNKDKADIWDSYQQKVLKKHPQLARFTGKDAIKKKIKDLEQRHKVLIEGSKVSGAGRSAELDTPLHQALEEVFGCNPLVNPQVFLDSGNPKAYAATTFDQVAASAAGGARSAAGGARSAAGGARSAAGVATANVPATVSGGVQTVGRFAPCVTAEIAAAFVQRKQGLWMMDGAPIWDHDGQESIGEDQREMEYEELEQHLKDPGTAARIEFRHARPVRGTQKTPHTSKNPSSTKRTAASRDCIDYEVDDENCNGRESSAKRKRADLVEVLNTSVGDSMTEFSNVLKDGNQLQNNALKESTNIMVSANEKALEKLGNDMKMAAAMQGGKTMDEYAAWLSRFG